MDGKKRSQFFSIGERVEGGFRVSSVRKAYDFKGPREGRVGEMVRR